MTRRDDRTLHFREIVPHHHDGHGLNDVTVIKADDRDPNAGGASHFYLVHRADVAERIPATADPTPDWDGPTVSDNPILAQIQFQHGARHEPGSVEGILDGALLAILIDRYEAFQAGPFACAENQVVLQHLWEAMHWMKHRADDRARRGVLGRNRQ